MHHAETTSRPQTGRGAALLLAALFVLMGVAALVWFALAVFNDPTIRAALAWTPAPGEQPPSSIMAFLTQFGIAMPLLVIGLSLAAIRLGLRLRKRDVVAARWAQSVLIWLTGGALVVAAASALEMVVGFVQRSNAPVDTTLIMRTGATLLAGLVLWWAWRWLRGNAESVFAGREQLSQREARVAWNLLMPTLVVFVFVAARPLEQTFIRSLTDKRFASPQAPNFVGLQNYQNLLGVRVDVTGCRVDAATGACATRADGTVRWESIDRSLMQQGYRTVWNIPLPRRDPPQALAISGADADFLQSIGTTLVFVVFSVTLELLLALFMALTVNSSFRGRGMMRAVMLIPWAIPTVISARLWELMLKDTSAGIINRVLMDLGVITAPQAWLSSVSLQLPAVILVDVWKTAPFMALLLLAGLQSISKDLYEAASVDGASAVRRFFAITLPLL
ncbi:MAG TPA: sugar ABC transporter permease, partial [Chloroflexi bacterium]|nr:sugar ABC transporter permease [Chloroflexota bacterium]